ncbi:hypothetical protein Za10_0382 [Zymomonas mobilis subsp. mobilis NCIMB 11163]|uniref:Uncharacterized protein n=1 Tax=Zymomonas mobilis subsp. mobilis (strain ATCC 10988 / DSM 424 / LMG 404 / NCIMB 8938 / NRRL B-806 / ZM1) TaxID=555217 RepID=A0A0H3FWS0_ZYMMA|nr:hypothetical protein Za10_0382 [Zymomonas mobilis subsp. mobilis NCIMB 11163]AEH62234.1 conserved hypothetical protein [Zymomonas mobilis subsp. mobilis ATCC 10988]AFN56285.1 hypothetical protein ZZ6_0384 [Zymomonas mobilis subsp. mobilis ATCC 29191]TQK78285.1 hypothetical protein FBY53_0950 [Zymomonas mobilis]TQL15068.1 hypothetical protein FBY51_0038 [Zymomonas mobilis]
MKKYDHLYEEYLNKKINLSYKKIHYINLLFRQMI